MKQFLLIMASFLSISAYAADYPVTWTKDMKVKSLAAIPALLSADIGKVHYIDNNDQKAVATSCNNYFRLTKLGYYPANNAELAAESYFKEKCDPLLLLLHARPAAESHVRNFDLKNDYKELPAAIVFPSITDVESPIGPLNLAFPDVTVEESPSPATSTTITLVTKAENMRAVISILAWGDFNHDRIDEMLVFVANYVPGGTYHSYTTYLLTKKSSSDPIVEVKIKPEIQMAKPAHL